MIQTWNSWKRFPDVRTGGQLDAPVGPGVYEVHHTLTGRVIAFGHTGDVANALNHLKLNGGGSILSRLFRRPPLAARVSELESAHAPLLPAPRPGPPPVAYLGCGRPLGAGAWIWAGRGR